MRNLLLALASVGIIVIIMGIINTNNHSWNIFIESYQEEKQEQSQFFIDEHMKELKVIVEAHAQWTDARNMLLMKHRDWLYENATGYMLDSENLNIDQVYISTEEEDFVQEYAKNESIDVTKLELYDQVLNDNEKISHIFWKDNKAILIAGSPLYDNNEENPIGVYILTRVLSSDEILELKKILVNSEIEVVTITAEPKYTKIESETFSDIGISIPIMIGDTEIYVNIDANIEYLEYIFTTQSRILIGTLVAVAIMFLLIVLLNLKRLVSKIVVIIRAVQNISNGDYHVKIDLENSSLMPEVDILIESINKMSNDVENHISVIENHSKVIDEKYIQMIELLVKTVELNDSYTYHHSVSVAEYSVMIGKAIGYEDIKNLELAAKLHDVGKISIATEILNKPAKLSHDEYKIIQSHSVEGYKLISEIDVFDAASDGILYHHERYDGKGYPYGLKGDEIPLMAQIITIADVYDALTSDRSYRKALECEDAMKIIMKDSGTAFNPELVDVFYEEIKKVKCTKNQMKDNQMARVEDDEK